MKACFIGHRSANERAWTIVELFAFIAIIYIPIAIGNIVAKQHGVWVGIGAGILTAIVCVTGVVLFYSANGRRNEQQRRALRERYRRIYRVIAFPACQENIKKPQSAEIKVGDFGWEAEPPSREDGLIYLQGLTSNWQVVWYAGFRPNEIEDVGFKPRSQYDWEYSWLRKAPPCPFPVKERETTSMGLPDAWGWNGRKRK